jgi:hypothetical protein
MCKETKNIGATHKERRWIQNNSIKMQNSFFVALRIVGESPNLRFGLDRKACPRMHDFLVGVELWYRGSAQEKEIGGRSKIFYLRRCEQ